MKKQSAGGASTVYFLTVILLMLVIPLISIAADAYYYHQDSWSLLAGKWFIFWALGMRLLTAGLRQVIRPAFTTQQIFHITETESYPIVRELGFANICMGTLGVLSLFMPEWRTAAAFVGGLYMGIAGLQHAIRGASGSNEVLAMLSDFFIAFVMTAYLICAL